MLHPAEPIKSTAELDPKVYGVIVQHGWRRGLLLPDIEGIDDAETQVRYAAHEGRDRAHEPVELQRFKVEKYV